MTVDTPGVVNMVRQAAIAVDVAIFVAVVASPGSSVARLAAFHRGWWVMTAITALGLVRTARTAPSGSTQQRS
jgi:hypothetical protein